MSRMSDENLSNEELIQKYGYHTFMKMYEEQKRKREMLDTVNTGKF